MPLDTRAPSVNLADQAHLNPTASVYSITPTIKASTSTHGTVDGRGFLRTPGELSLLPRALEVQDLVVLSLLFLAKQDYAAKVAATRASEVAFIGTGMLRAPQWVASN